jgi:serine/threonine-protein kinase
MAPENILIDAQNNISFLKKTPSTAYRAPEETKGLELDIRADIFSLGVILYEMLTGSLDGLGSASVMDVAHDVPDWLDEIVIRCIRKVREDRYQSIDEILADVKGLSQSKKAPG